MTPVDHDMLSAYFDGELSPAEASRVERLLADEPAWASAFSELQSLDAVLDAVECPAAPRELASRIVAAAKAQPRQERPAWVRVLRLAGPMAAAASVVLAVVLVGPWRTGSDNQVGGPAVVTNGQTDAANHPLALAEVDQLARQELLFFSNMDTIQALADNESLLNAATMDALAALEAPGAGRYVRP